MAVLAPSIITTKEAHDYVGGIKVWWELLALYHAKLLKPFRTLPRGDQLWQVATIDAVVRLAQTEGVLNDRIKVERAMRQAIKDGVIPKAALVASAKASEANPPS